MARNNDATDATLTEHLAAADAGHAEIDGPAKVTHIVDGRGIWTPDDAEELADDPDEYKAVCSCGESFGSWNAAAEHAEEDH